MTVQLTKYQYEQIVAHSKNDDNNIDETNRSFINDSRPMAGVYAYILSLISKNNDPGQGPAVGVDHGIWQWFQDAKDINNGGGVFSVSIREYTAEQRRIRLRLLQRLPSEPDRYAGMH